VPVGRGTSGDAKTLRATREQALGPIRHAFHALAAGSEQVTQRAAHVRDAISMRRFFAVYLVALAPLILFGLYNTGLQIHLALAGEIGEPLETWQTGVMKTLGLGFDPDSFVACLIHGALYFLPLLFAIYLTARVIELLFAVIRRMDLPPGTMIYALLFALLLPPTAPIWQSAFAMGFGILVAKEIFGGTGRNVVHPVLLAWAFLYVSYPAALSGEAVWVPVSADVPMLIDIVDEQGMAGLEGVSWMSAFVGLSPGPLGVSSALFCFIGVGALLLARLISWRIVAGFVLGSFLASLLFQGESADNAMFGVPFYWHMVLGGWAFGLAFIVTDPVTAAHTRAGRLLYGIIAGAFVVVVRVLNPVQLDGTAIALLFMSLFAPLIDHFVIEANIKRRGARYALKSGNGSP
jgi:Na+-transporting NADH:ubiquinone oxidoreductase subunit B